jgi:hypothetical protein
MKRYIKSNYEPKINQWLYTGELVDFSQEVYGYVFESYDGIGNYLVYSNDSDLVKGVGEELRKYLAFDEYRTDEQADKDIMTVYYKLSADVGIAIADNEPIGFDSYEQTIWNKDFITSYIPLVSLQGNWSI